jgi:hypothetical protein
LFSGIAKSGARLQELVIARSVNNEAIQIFLFAGLLPPQEMRGRNDSKYLVMLMPFLMVRMLKRS